MTRAEWNAAMQRYMHRADITGDLDQTFAFAQGAFDDAWMGQTLPYTDDASLLAMGGRPMTHAGLSYLHELAQDDVGHQREVGMFNAAMAGLQMRTSLNAGPACMVRPQDRWIMGDSADAP